MHQHAKFSWKICDDASQWPMTHSFLDDTVNYQACEMEKYCLLATFSRTVNNTGNSYYWRMQGWKFSTATTGFLIPEKESCLPAGLLLAWICCPDSVSLHRKQPHREALQAGRHAEKPSVRSEEIWREAKTKGGGGVRVPGTIRCRT